MPQRRRDGDTRPRRIEAHAHGILALHADRRDIMLDELLRELCQAGVIMAIPALPYPQKCRPCGQQDRADILSARED